MRTSPALVCFVGAIASILKVYWYGDSARRPPTAALSCARDAGKSAGKMYRLLFGKFLRTLAGSPKFFDSTDGGVRLTQSERRKVLSPKTHLHRIPAEIHNHPVPTLGSSGGILLESTRGH